jgi:L-threonylcarbamoyladenylate synthase
LKTDLISGGDENTISRAVELLARGEVVALPTETVYGLAADATNAQAVAKIFEAKERPFFDPLIVHLPSLDWLDRITQNRDPLVEKLVAKFWPGPLTLVLQKRDNVPDLVTSGLTTVAVRMSAHPVFREVCARFGKPLAAPSANRFGRISPTAAEHVLAELGGRIPLIIDGGATMHGVESTIVAVENRRIKILRAGPVTREELSEFGEVIFEKRGDTPNAPGQLESHYAPRTPMRIADCGLRIADFSGVRVGLLARDSSTSLRFAQNDSGGEFFSVVEVLSASGDLREAAANLFSKMRTLDEAGLDLILAEPVPEVGLGVAIMDRLRKASANG